jgi:predicted TIM-barrel fold metal-dependent hydrolase
MDLAGIDKVLLLPIAQETGTLADFERRMDWVKSCYGGQCRFSIAGSVPGFMAAGELKDYAKASKARYGITAMKCHPVVSGIDLSSDSGREWFQELIEACHHSALPLIVHGGRNNPYWGGSRSDFGALEHLKRIDFSRSNKPVVIAHAGLHRCRQQDVTDEGLTQIHALLDTHPNLFLDISNLTMETLKKILGRMPIQKLLFGSDALYSSQWMSVVLTLHTLRELGMDLEENYLLMASINPQQTLFED